MFKKSLMVLALLQSTYALAEESKPPKYLHWRMSDTVVITISNVECPFKYMKNEYPFASIATRIDGEKLAGCFKPLNENDIQIQWYKGDTTILPANAFLQKPIENIEKQPPSTL